MSKIDRFMNELSAGNKSRSIFLENMPAGLLRDINTVERRLLLEYGAVFVARGGVIPPDRIVFRDESEVSTFQAGLRHSGARIGDFDLELQQPAMAALQKAIHQAKEMNLSITPRGADSARRNYKETVDLWASRVDPALEHWLTNGRIAQADVDRIRSLSPFEQVPVVFELEERGVYFAKGLSKSIIYSVAPPGASQHLSMLALDIREHEDVNVRKILVDHGWFQTVVSDLPHFTFLGVAEGELTELGLKMMTDGGREFWIPNV